MQKKFIFSNSTVQVVTFSDQAALDELPPKVYVVKYDEMMGYYLEIIKDELDTPNKIYGNVYNRARKCIQTYKDRTSSLGVLMTGDKGTGKSLLMSVLANETLNELKLPVIVIKQAYRGELFASFLNDIGECCIILDEFGKMYQKSVYREKDGVSQNEFLSILDGVDKIKRMFIMTENSELDISEFILNRPSRVYYHFKYKKLDEDSIIGYCEDNNIKQSVVDDIVHFSRNSSIFSFDMLKAIVEEHLRFNEPIDSVINDLNIKTKDSDTMIHFKRIVKKGTDEEVKPRNPFINKPYGNAYIELVDNKGDYDSEFVISNDELVYEHNGKLVYETSEFTIMAEEVPSKTKDYSLLV